MSFTSLPYGREVLYAKSHSAAAEKHILCSEWQSVFRILPEIQCFLVHMKKMKKVLDKQFLL